MNREGIDLMGLEIFNALPAGLKNLRRKLHKRQPATEVSTGNRQPATKLTKFDLVACGN